MHILERSQKRIVCVSNAADPERRIAMNGNLLDETLEIKLKCRIESGKILLVNELLGEYISLCISTFPSFQGKKPCFLQKRETWSNFKVTSKMKRPDGFYEPDDVFILALKISIKGDRLIPEVEIMEETELLNSF